MHHDLKLKTSSAYERIEHLLEACCSKLYSMTFEGIEDTDDGPRKVIRISFEDPGDRERFRSAYQRSRDDLDTSALAAGFSDAVKYPSRAQ